MKVYPDGKASGHRLSILGRRFELILLNRLSCFSIKAPASGLRHAYVLRRAGCIDHQAKVRLKVTYALPILSLTTRFIRKFGCGLVGWDRVGDGLVVLSGDAIGRQAVVECRRTQWHGQVCICRVRISNNGCWCRLISRGSRGLCAQVQAAARMIK